MTHKILKSALAPPPTSVEVATAAFRSLVEKYIFELQTWHDHHIIVNSLADTPWMQKPNWEDFADHKDPAAAFTEQNAAWERERLERHKPYPKPDANKDIVAAVATSIQEDGSITYVPDFEVINDDPTPEEILAEKRTVLIAKVLAAEERAIQKVLPTPGKRRIADRLEADIRANDERLSAEIGAKRQNEVRSHQEICDKIMRENAAISQKAIEDFHRSSDEVARLNSEARLRVVSANETALAKAAKKAADQETLRVEAAFRGEEYQPEPVPPVELEPEPTPKDMPVWQPPELKPLPPTPSAVDVAAEIEARRPPKHTKHLLDQQARRDKVGRIERAAALAMSNIEDMALENIDGYDVPDFSDLI